MAFNQNNFLLDLLSFQQDGSRSIVGPELWKQDNLLEIETDKTKQAKKLAKKLIKGDKQYWHFYIGSPGNGKSHLVGIIYKAFIEAGWKCQELEEGGVAYKYTWKKPDEKFSRVWFIQDASSVKNPFDNNPDEGKDLIEELIDAHKRGISLIICANRGILEKLNSAKKFDKKAEWARSIDWLLNSSNESESFTVKGAGKDKKTSIEVKAEELDSESLVSTGSNIINDLFEQTLSDENWSTCGDCEASDLCPFYNNKESIKNEVNQRRLSKIFRHAELITGQIIVFRELMALNSLLFSGTSIDYQDQHPCDWVMDKCLSKNFISLLSKRFYYTLLSSFEPSGLEKNEGLRKEQLDLLYKCLDLLDEQNPSYLTLNSFMNEEKPSLELGINRLIGKEGSISRLDPVKEGLDNKFLQCWALESKELRENLEGLEEDFKLEKRAIDFWSTLLDFLDKETSEDSIPMAKLIERWSSSMLLRLGGFYKNKTWMNKSLKEFDELLNSINNKGDSEAELSRKLRKVGKEINKILSRISSLEGEDSGVRLSDSLEAIGEGVEKATQVNILSFTEPPHLKFSCMFGSGETTEADFYMGGLVFSWLKKVEELNLVGRSIPKQIFESILQSRSRSVSKSNFTRNGEALDLKTKDNEGTLHKLIYEGEPETPFVE